MINKLQLFTALILATTSICNADTLPGSSVALKYSLAEACSNNDCDGLAAGTFSCVHRIEVNPAILAQIDSNTSITIEGIGGRIRLIMRDDPGYVEGATSARFAKVMPYAGAADGTIDVTATATWGDGVFAIALKGKFSGEPSIGKLFAPAVPKDIPAYNLSTTIEKPGNLMHRTRVNLPLYEKAKYYDYRAASGDTLFRAAYDIKSPR